MDNVGAGLFVLAFPILVAGANEHRTTTPHGPHAERAAPLALVVERTPRLRVAGYDTSGTYPQVAAKGIRLRAVNAALRAAVVADQRAYAPYARRAKARYPSAANGVYRTAVDRRLASASTVVASALLTLTREVFPGQAGGDGWLAVTVQVPSGQRVAISDLFSNRDRGIQVLADAWRARIRATAAASCLKRYPSNYRATVRNYGAFALTPRGVAVGSWEAGACYRLVAIVPYRVLRPYFSALGSRLVAGVRRPR